jgi:hypothetical protein
MSAQWAQFLKVTFTQLTLICAQSAALVLMFAQAAQFLKDKIAKHLQNKIPGLMVGDFCIEKNLRLFNLPHIGEVQT